MKDTYSTQSRPASAVGGDDARQIRLAVGFEGAWMHHEQKRHKYHSVSVYFR